MKLIKYVIIDKGAIFCQVNKINEEFQLIPSITFGNQKWKGAIPVLIIKGKEIIVENKEE